MNNRFTDLPSNVEVCTVNYTDTNYPGHLVNILERQQWNDNGMTFDE